jgi:predicted nucleotidyltransferase
VTVPATLVDNPILARLCKDLRDAYGERIERIVLFGSRARGDAYPDSDYDVALFLRDMSNRWKEMDRLAEIETAILDDIGAFVQVMPYPEGFWREHTPLMHEVRLDGVDL